MSVEVLNTAKEMINQLRSKESSHPDCPDYLFDILRIYEPHHSGRSSGEMASGLYRGSSASAGSHHQGAE